MILFYIVISIIIINYLLFLTLIWIGIKLVKSKRLSNYNNFSVSIIIPFRNESENIDNLLGNLNDIDYPNEKLEIILVDDYSTDDSVEKIQKHIKPNIKLLTNNQVENGFKKAAIEKAINVACGDVIVLTDADCSHQKNWLKKMISYFEDNVAMVVGPVKFNEGESLFYKFQQLEYAGLMLTAAGLVGIKKPKICSSANLAFLKSAFEKVNGYQDNAFLSSGDDELLMQKISKLPNQKIEYCWNKEAVVETKSNKNVKSFFLQRQRWASKSLFYDSKLFISLLVFIFLFYLSIIVLPIISIFNSSYFFFFIIALFMKLIFEYVIMKEGADLLFNKSNMKYFLTAEFLQIPYIIISAILGIKGNYFWKDRKVKR